MADVASKGCDSVITIGGIQSNHCRATAVAARYKERTWHAFMTYLHAASQANANAGMAAEAAPRNSSGQACHLPSLHITSSLAKRTAPAIAYCLLGCGYCILKGQNTMLAVVWLCILRSKEVGTHQA